MKKTVFKADDTQIEKLYSALKGGAPLLLALEYAGISRASYYYWVAVASVVVQVKTQEELEEVEELVHSGVSLQQVRDISESEATSKRTSVGTFIEPPAESVLQYKNSRKFRKFADRCYEVVSECNRIRSGVALNHIINIQRSTDKKNRINASGSMWFLERTYGDFFNKPSEKAAQQQEERAVVPAIQVEYVDPNTQETQDRVHEMETELLEKLNGKGSA